MGIQADRKNYFMSVEFALKRELEYKQKLQKKVSGESQVPRPASSQDTRGTPRSASNHNMSSAHGPVHRYVSPSSVKPPLYSYPAPNSRPSSSSGSSNSAHQLQNAPVSLPQDIFKCKLCQLDCKTGFNLLSHYQGHKHKAKVRAQNGKEVAGGKLPRENEKRPYCDVCGIWCADDYTYKLHFSCTNHILKQYDWLMKKGCVVILYD